MVNVNFLPWRRLLQEHQIKTLKKILSISICVSMLLAISTHVWVTFGEHQLIEKVNELTQVLAQLDEEQKLLQRNVSSGQEQSNYSGLSVADLSAFFSALTQQSPQSVCFSVMTRRKNTLTFSGESRSIEDLSSFIGSWVPAKYFSEIKIEKLTEIEKHKVQFRLRAIERLK